MPDSLLRFQRQLQLLAHGASGPEEAVAALEAMATEVELGALARRGLVTKDVVVDACAAYRSRGHEWTPTAVAPTFGSTFSSRENRPVALDHRLGTQMCCR